MFNRLIYIACLIFISQKSFAGMPAKVVEVIEIRPTTVVQHTKLIGSIKAQRESQVQAEASGVVDKIVALEGTFVKKGTILAELRNSNERSKLEIARNQAAIAKSQYDRMAKLYPDVISDKELKDARTELLSKQRALHEAQESVAKIVIRAPIDGICGVFKVTEGTFVKTSDVVVDLVDTSTLKVEFGVPQNLLAKLKAGQEVIIGEHTGTIEAVSRTINGNTLMGIARASLRECENCLIGATVDVSLAVNEKSNVLAVPREAVFLKDGASHVYVAKEGKSLLKPVKVGISTSDTIEIVNGLIAGDLVVAKGHQRLRHEGEVKIAS